MGTASTTLELGSLIPSATTTFQLPAIIMGNLTINSDHFAELSAGAPNVMIPDGDLTNKPYFLRVMGDLTMASGTERCRITGHQPRSGGWPGAALPVNGQIPPPASIFIFVDGTVSINTNCKIQPFSTPLGGQYASYVRVISTSGGTNVAGQVAIQLNGARSGSEFFATRGGALVQSSNVNPQTIKTLSSNWLDFELSSGLQYSEGRPVPYSPFGGREPGGAEVIRFNEVE